MRLVVAALLALLLATMAPRPAFAHVLITDTTKTEGAILHINPDDDPIAGQKATLFLDTQGKLLTATSTATLQVTDTATDATATVAMTVNGSLAIADYTFPSQGVYELSVTITSGGSTHTFVASQRVSRGTVRDAASVPHHQWAEGLLLASGLGFVLVAIIVFNRRRAIAKQSTF